jgi:hypothetical protein
MPAPLLAPHVPPDFPPLAAAGGLTVSPGGPTALRIGAGGRAGGPTALRIGAGGQAGGPTASPGGQTARRTGVGGPTASPGGSTA